MTQSENFPAISIITPSYNQAQFLEKTIQSIIGQGYPNLEFIIIDGGSTDHSVEIIKKYESQITYWVSEKDLGTYDANNKALQKVTGDFWCIVNSDDLLLPGSLYKIAEAIQSNPNQKWFVGGVDYIDENGNKTGQEMPVSPNDVGGFLFLNGCWISHPTVFLSKTLINEIGQFDKFHLMDFNYWLRLEAKGYKPMILSDYLAALRIHTNCKSFDLIKIQEEVNKVLTHFVFENNLQTNKSIQAKLKVHKGNYYKIVFLTYIYNNKFKQALVLIAAILKNDINVLRERWFWGAMKRLVFGVSKNDAFADKFSFEKSNANWNTIE